MTQKHAIAVRPEAWLSCEDGTWSSVCVRATGQSSQVLACESATLDFSRRAHSAYLFPAACRDDRQKIRGNQLDGDIMGGHISVAVEGHTF